MKRWVWMRGNTAYAAEQMWTKAVSASIGSRCRIANGASLVWRWRFMSHKLNEQFGSLLEIFTEKFILRLNYLSAHSRSIQRYIRTLPVRRDRLGSWKDGRLSSSWSCWASGDHVRFFDGDEFLDESCGVLGTGTCIICGPLRVWRVVASKIRVLVAAPGFLSLPIGRYRWLTIGGIMCHSNPTILYFQMHRDRKIFMHVLHVDTTCVQWIPGHWQYASHVVHLFDTGRSHLSMEQ